MHILESQNFSNLTITQWRFILSHLAGDLRFGIVLCQKLLRRLLDRDCIIRSIENLKAESVFLDCQVTNLPQIASINVRPSIPLAPSWFRDIAREITLICARIRFTFRAEECLHNDLHS